MSYNYSYGSDSSDDEYVPRARPPPQPPAPPARRYNSYDPSDDDQPFSAPTYSSQSRQLQPPPPPPPSLQPGRGYGTAPPPPKVDNYAPGASSYRASPPPSTYSSPPYQSPPPSAYHSPPPSQHRAPPPSNYQSAPPSNYQAPHSNYQPASSKALPPANFRGSTPPSNYRQSQPPPPPPAGAYHRGPPPSGTYRPSPPPVTRGTPPSASTVQQTPHKPYAPSGLNRAESYSEDYSAYGLSNTSPRPATGRYMTEDMSGRVGERNARDLETPPAMDRRKTEQMVLAIGANVKRDEASMAAKIGDLVSSSSEKLTAAQGIVDKVIANDTFKLAKDQVEIILSPAKDVIAILDVMKNIHPVIGAVTTIFTILIKLEVDRRENDKSIAVLHLAMTNLLFILSYLEPTFDTTDKIKTILQKYLEEVCKTMNQFGNFCDTYYKQRGMVRMIRSGGYKTKLAGFATSFEDHKKELQYLMTTKTAATVTKMDSNVQEVSAKLDQVLAFINLQNPKERAIAKRIQEYPGGEDAAVLDDKLLAKIGKLLKEEISSQTKFALRENIDDVLKSNFARFGLKVETAMHEIKDAVERSTETIMTRLDSGPHDLIEDEDIKAVWKEMNWRLSCKCRHFVDAVHHHYAQKFGKYTLETGEPHPERWTLKFLGNIIFYPAIGDAIDEDGSGYISVHEANRFFNSRPRSWTPPQWMAYWAVGWYMNAVSYRHRCVALLESIEKAAKKVMPQNRSALKPYLKKDCYGKIDLMISGLYTDNLQYHGEATGSEYESLGKFRRERMDDEMNKMKAHLAKPNYELDSKEAVLAVLGTHRVETSVLCLLYLVLRRHKKILDFASSLVLEEMEFETLVECIENISSAFETRFRNLMESWRQQRIDTKLQIGCFHGGLYQAFHEEYYDNQSDSDSDWDYELDPSDDEEWKAEEAAAHAEDASDPRKAKDILLYGIPPQPSRAETQKLKKELEAKKAKKKRECSYPVLTTTPVPAFSTTTTPDQLASHHRHLEALLDSALATVTLINAATTPHTPLGYTSHVTLITQALSHYIHASVLDCETSAGPATTESPYHAPIPTTYADVARSRLPMKPDPHTTKQPILPPATSPQARLSDSQSLIIRFDLDPMHTPTRPDPEVLHFAVEDALDDPSLFGGARWSQRGNLILYAARDVHPRFLSKRRSKIWAAIHPLLGLPKEHPLPVFETDDHWHSVVLHGVPISTAEKPGILDADGARLWLLGCKGAVKAVSVLCRPENYKTKDTVAVRVSLSSEEDAHFLVNNGASFYGTKKAKREASVPLLDSDSDVETSYKGKTNDNISSYDSEEGSDDYSTGAGEYDRAKSAAKLNEYDSDDYEKYENSDIWDSDSDSESGNSSDSSASNFVTMKEKKPSVDKRLTDLEEQLSDMQATLKQILSLTKKSISNR